ncbi:MAG: YqjF family protein [Blastocatellia bacterium]
MSQSRFLIAEWRHLAMLNYEIAPALLAPSVPCGVELDTWNGRNFVSVIGFLFLKTRVLGLPVPFHGNFEEINLRFYVRRRAENGWRRGVVFIKEIVPRWAIATVARVVYNENYIARPMSHLIDLDSGAIAPNGSVEYSWLDDGSWHRMRARTAGESQALATGSEEEFITEHYWGYAKQRGGDTVEYQVEHPRWRVWRTSEADFECDVKRVYGHQFVECLSAKPSSAFVADGSAVVVRKGVRI